MIARDADAARAMGPFVPGARVVVDAAFTFEPGVDVTHVDDVKGLEFDDLLVPDATAAAYPDTPDARRRLYVAMTRASHTSFGSSPPAALHRSLTRS